MRQCCTPAFQLSKQSSTAHCRLDESLAASGCLFQHAAWVWETRPNTADAAAMQQSARHGPWQNEDVVVTQKGVQRVHRRKHVQGKEQVSAHRISSLLDGEDGVLQAGGQEDGGHSLHGLRNDAPGAVARHLLEQVPVRHACAHAF